MVNLSVELVNTTDLGYVYRFTVSGGAAGAAVTLEKKNEDESSYGFLGTINLNGVGSGINETFYALQYKGLNVSLRAVYDGVVVASSGFVVGGGVTDNMLMFVGLLAAAILAVLWFAFKGRKKR